MTPATHHTRRPAADRPVSEQQKRQERKERVLTQGTPSITSSIADALVTKDGNVFLVTKPDGGIPLESGHGFGLYFRDGRFVNGYELRLADTELQALVSNAEQDFMAVLQLTNADIRMDDGRLIRKETIGVKWERVIHGGEHALYDRLTFQNLGVEEIHFPVSLTFRAEFEDVFTVRGLLPTNIGELRPPSWSGAALQLAEAGADGVFRVATIKLWPPPPRVEDTTAHFELTLAPRETTQVLVSIRLTDSANSDVPAADPHQPARDERSAPDIAAIAASLQRAADRWLDRHTQVRSDSVLLDRLVGRSLRDLGMLRSRLNGEDYIAAGLPWFGTLFGRDALITALQTLAFDPTIAEETVRLLARYQGQRVDAWRDEQPGKILHELRVGELARAGEIPHTPYYGTIDATPLFLVVIARHAAWTGDLALFEELRESVEAALTWIAEYGDLDGDGYLEYASSSEAGLVNQGWKDSGDAIVSADGSLATPPIALAEVQGYVYMAKAAVAALLRRAGDAERAGRLEREADELRARFDRDFWLEESGIYALALEGDKRPAAVVSSNAGHALWAGIALPEKARRTMERLLVDDMFSGWGIRTLSTTERRYNPIGYHLGTVWPHDNALIAAGFRRYGFDEAAQRIFGGLVDAAIHFEGFRLPELFAGFSRAEFSVPGRYPVANHPQAWGAGSALHLLVEMLGLRPDAFERRLRIARPIIPEFVDWLEMRGLRVGPARVDLRFERSDERTEVRVLDASEGLDIAVEY